MRCQGNRIKNSCSYLQGFEQSRHSLRSSRLKAFYLIAQGNALGIE